MNIPLPRLWPLLLFSLERNQDSLEKWLIPVWERKGAKRAWDLLLDHKTRKPTEINGAVQNRSKIKYGEATTGQSCGNLDLKKNNELNGLKQIQSMKNQ